jgi:hypothetical protein
VATDEGFVGAELDWPADWGMAKGKGAGSGVGFLSIFCKVLHL